jgi:hypothetical protein
MVWTALSNQSLTKSCNVPQSRGPAQGKAIPHLKSLSTESERSRSKVILTATAVFGLKSQHGAICFVPSTERVSA